MGGHRSVRTNHGHRSGHRSVRSTASRPTSRTTNDKRAAEQEAVTATQAMDIKVLQDANAALKADNAVLKANVAVQVIAIKELQDANANKTKEITALQEANAAESQKPTSRSTG